MIYYFKPINMAGTHRIVSPKPKPRPRPKSNAAKSPNLVVMSALAA